MPKYNYEKIAPFSQIFVARQPVFNRKMLIWGYELFFRRSLDSEIAQIVDGEQATSQMVIDGLYVAQESIPNHVKKMINFDQRSLKDKLPYALPSGTVVEILETVPPNKDILELCNKLKENYILAVDDYDGSDMAIPFLYLADIVKVDLISVGLENLKGLVEYLNNFKVTLLAEKIEDQSSLNYARKLGFELFQGFFFSKPENISGKKMTSNQISKLKLLKEIESEDNLQELTEIVETDVSISYRLMRHINSPGIGLLCEVKSIPHAVKMLGERGIKNWIRALILSDLIHKEKPQELVHLSVTRAHFLQNLSQFNNPPFDIESMFLIGLFSMLDIILEQPMKSLLQYINIQSEIEATLLREEINQASEWLDLCRYYEKGQWNKVKEVISHQGLDFQNVAYCYNQASVKTYWIFHS